MVRLSEGKESGAGFPVGMIRYPSAQGKRKVEVADLEDPRSPRQSAGEVHPKRGAHRVEANPEASPQCLALQDHSAVFLHLQSG